MTYKTVKPTTPHKPRADGLRGNRMNWYRRNVRKDMEPVEYLGLNEAIERARL